MTTHTLLERGRVVLLALCAALLLGGPAHAQSDPLPSWNDTGPKRAIVAFVDQVTKEGSPYFRSGRKSSRSRPCLKAT